MLIDRTYFVGELSIPNTGELAVQERLDWFIEKYEPELLKSVLGLPLYRQFMTGLSASPVMSKWTDLLQGVDYVAASKPYDWQGIVPGLTDVINAVNSSGSIPVTVGAAGDNDPVANASSVTIPASLVGKQFSFEQRSYGELLKDVEYAVSGDTLTLLGSATFYPGAVYFYRSSSLVTLSQSTGSVKKSMIANYVYYKWLRDQATQTSGVGEVMTKTENSARTSPAQKMATAWNEMVESVWWMWHFLDSNRTVYTEWLSHQVNANNYRYINTMNI